MSWQIASFGILGLVLLGGFAWYERSSPPSQTVALVAAMAALAVAGRIAFPVLPNVVATTDIVFFTGYAIGAAPGFATGALAGLVSNFWLGQGPWTPWQMGAWGLVGLVGAATASLTGRRLNRWGLAAACGILGYAFGALMDFSLMVTYGGDQTLDRFLALSARGVPFNVAHATGNIVIALVAGPALVRMLIRFRERFEVRWSPRPALFLLVAAGVAFSLAVSADRAEAKGQGPAAATAYLRTAQNADGGFGSEIGGESNASMTGWVALGLESAGINPLDLAKPGGDPITYLRANAKEVTTIGDIERTILILRAAGLGARGFGGRDLVADLRRLRDSDGSWDGQVNMTAFGILALKAAGSTGGVTQSAAWLAGAQGPSGGWGFALKAAPDADSTGAALQALAAAGGHQAEVDKGVAFLRANQRPGGGFPLLGGAVNAQSTAWAVQGLVAVGANPGSLQKGGNPLGYLAGLQAPDGHYRYSASSDQTPVWVTTEVLLALNRAAFPLSPVPRSAKPAAAPAGTKAPVVAGSGTAESNGGQPAAPTHAAPQAVPPAPGSVDAADAEPSSPSAEPEADDDSSMNAALIAAGSVLAACLLAGSGWVLFGRRPE